jgi:general secretion pathway protein K
VRRPSLLAAGRRKSRGFALLIVLWTLVLIAFVVAHITASGRSEIRIANNLVDNAVARAAADGAIAAAIFSLSNPRPEQRWPLDGAPRRLAVGDSRIALRVVDEASYINPNLASPQLLQALLLTLGANPQLAQRVAVAIADWVGSAQDPRPPEALLADYRAAGLDYQPPAAPLESLDELGRVLGVTPAVLAALRPHLSLYAPAEPSRQGTDPVVAAAAAKAASSSEAATPAATTPDVVTARITAVASGPDKAEVERIAVVRTGAALAGGYAVLAWGDRLD